LLIRGGLEKLGSSVNFKLTTRRASE
jgi:hypothetical protein